MAPPPKLTPTVRTRIAGIVRRTGNYTDAARSCKIDYSTVRKWRRIGEAVLDPDHPDHPAEPDDHAKQCSLLVLAVAEAEGEFLSEAREKIREHGLLPSVKRVTVRRTVPGKEGEVVETVEYREEEIPADWKALAWGVDRHSPPKQGVEVSGPDGGPIEVDAAGTLAEVRAAIAAMRGTPVEPDR